MTQEDNLKKKEKAALLAQLHENFDWLDYQVRCNHWHDRIAYLLKKEREETLYDIKRLRWQISSATKEPTISSKVIAGLKSVLACLKWSGKK